MKKFDADFHDGSGYHVDLYEPLAEPVWKTVDHELEDFKTKWASSTTVFDSIELRHTLENWVNYTQITIKSWDLMDQFGVGGTIVRFENSKTHKRTDDFKFNVRPRGFDRLKPNMDRLRQEVDCAIIGLDSYQVGGIERYSGITATGDLQLIVSRIGTQFRYGWIALGDQLFIPITNKWRDTGAGTRASNTPSWDIQQALKQNLTIEQAIDYQRQQELL